MKALALASALLLAGLLAIIGLATIGTGGPDSYVWPSRVGFGSLIGLPIGYWFIARRVLRPVGGALIVALMAVIAIALWTPLVANGPMLVMHGPVLAIWTAVWTVAALPFMRVVAKGLRAPRK